MTPHRHPLEVPGTLRLPVAVLVERRPGATRWAEWTWRVAEVLEGDLPALPPWTLLREEPDGRRLFLAGAAEVSLFPSDTAGYRENLLADPPKVWVVLREAPGAEPVGLALQRVTVDAGEAHIYADAGTDLLEALPIPAGLRAAAEAFVAEHHRERGFHKRRRDRADPEALGRRGPGQDGGPRRRRPEPLEDQEG